MSDVTHNEALALLALLEAGVEANPATTLRLARALVASMGEAERLRSRLEGVRATQYRLTDPHEAGKARGR